MTNISLFERLKTIINLVKSQSFFVTLFIILLLTIIVLVINIRVKSKAPKYAAAIAYTGLAILVLARYGNYILSLNDGIVDKFFRAMYFPNIVVYISMLILTILFLIAVIINDKYLTFTKICSVFSFFVTWFLFVLTVDSVKTEGLSFYEVTEIYANGTIMILMQASMCVFGLWCGVLLADLAIRKLSEKIDKKQPMLVNDSSIPIDKGQSIFEIVLNKIKKNKDEEVQDYTDQEFNDNYLNNNNIANNQGQINDDFTNKL